MATKKKLLQAAAGTAAAGGAVLNVEEVFSTYLYESAGTTQTITNDIDLSGEGGMVWFKRRNLTSNHRVYDTERGMTSGAATPYLYTNDTAGNLGTSYSDSIVATSTGFDITSTGIGDISDNGGTYASWTFRKAPKFFTCLTYTGNGTAGRTVSHDLGTTVGTIIVKRTDSARSWYVFHRSVGSTKYLALNGTDAAITSSSYWNDTDPTSTEFTLGSQNGVNASGGTYVAYLFAHNDGDGDFGPDGDADIIKCGSYSGNGSSTGPVIDLGFEPQWLLIRRTDDTSDWLVWDAMRGAGSNNTVKLKVNAADTEDTLGEPIGFNATGFQPLGADSEINNGSGTYIYIAIRRGPMAVPTDATDVFDVETSTSGAPRTWSSGFPVDLSIYCHRDTYTSNKYVGTRLTGNNAYLVTNGSGAEGSVSNAVEFDYSDKIIENNLGDTNSKVNWMWRRAPNYFDVVAYTGTGTAGYTISHNLGVAPEMVWIKRRDATGNWMVLFNMDGSSSDDLVLEGVNISNTRSYPNTFLNSSPTSTEIVLGSNSDVNASSTSTHIAYLFASLDGVSKFGTYTGNGSSQTIDCGFSNGARFVLIKRTDSTSDWWVFDTARGIVAGNDGLLALNGNATEGSSYDNIDPDSSGFIINNTAWNENASGGTYIFYAIA